MKKKKKKKVEFDNSCLYIVCGKKNEPNVDNVKKKDLFWVFLDIEGRYVTMTMKQVSQ